MTSQTIELDLIPQGVAPIIHVSQYDKGQTWLFNLRAGDAPFSVPAGSTITIQGTKPDHTGFQYPCTFSGSTVTATEDQQMTIIAGDVPAEIRIAKSGDIIASLNFVIRVEPAALPDDIVVSDTYLSKIEQAIEAGDEAQGYAEDAEAWAQGTRNGSPVGSSDPTFHNNAKYYADNFVGCITDAQWAQIQALLV